MKLFPPAALCSSTTFVEVSLVTTPASTEGATEEVLNLTNTLGADVPMVLLDGKNTQSDRCEVSQTVLSG